jgi:hypothetical protein
MRTDFASPAACKYPPGGMLNIGLKRFSPALQAAGGSGRAALARRRLSIMLAPVLVCMLAGGVIAINAGMAEAAWTALICGILAAACLSVGGICAKWLHRDLPVELCFLLGFIAFGYILAVPAQFLGMSILVSAVLFLAFALLASVRRPAVAEDPDLPSLLLMLLAVAGFAGIWSLESTHRLAKFDTTGIFHLWIDFFNHAALIAEFGDVRALG